jgi:hypothetical protein
MNASDFLTPQWYDSLRLAGSNPSVLGFFTEQMLLSWISVNGCPLGGKEFAVRPKTITFPGKKPEMDPDEGFALYVPISFNFRAVDAVMVFRDKARTEAVVVGVQITISKTHSDSETKFFADWQWWESVLGCSKVSFRFLWILEDAKGKLGTEDVDAGKRPLRGTTKVFHPPFTRTRVTVKDISKDIGERFFSREFLGGWCL